MKKKLLALFLMLTLAFTTTFVFAEASSSIPVTIIKDNAKVRIVETNDEQFIYRVTVNKIDNTAQMQITDKMTKKVKISQKAQLGLSDSKEALTSNSSSIMATRATLEQNTFTNYEYTKTYGTPNQWQLRRPDSSILSYYYFNTAETSSNRPYLESFKGAVQRINDTEVPMVASIGAAGIMDLLSVGSVVAAICTGGMLSGAAWTVIVASLGMTGISATLLIQYNAACVDAFDAYNEVFKRKA